MAKKNKQENLGSLQIEKDDFPRLHMSYDAIVDVIMCKKYQKEVSQIKNEWGNIGSNFIYDENSNKLLIGLTIKETFPGEGSIYFTQDFSDHILELIYNIIKINRTGYLKIIENKKKLNLSFIEGSLENCLKISEQIKLLINELQKAREVINSK